MRAWKRISLGDVSESVDYGVTASARGTPVGPKFLRITDIQDGGVDWNTVPWCASDSATAAAELRAGDIVFARTGATTGKSYLIRDCPTGAVFASYLIRVRVAPDVEPRFISHFFQTPDYWAQITKSANGVAQPGVNATTLRSIKVPLPPLPEQRRIAEILDKADALRAKRRIATAQLDTLTKSVFLDMFGDPISNGKCWPSFRLEELATKITDGTHKTPVYQESGVEFLSAKDLKDGGIEWGTGKFISEQEHQELLKRCNPESGDVLLAKSGSLGSVAIIDRVHQFSLFESLCLIKHNRSKTDGQYLVNLLRIPSMLLRLLGKNKGVAIKHLHLVDVRNLQVPLPPMSLQLEFARRIAEISRLKASQRVALAKLNELFASLQYRAFNGCLAGPHAAVSEVTAPSIRSH